MGKVKKKKFSGHKPQPTGLPSVSECEAEIELEGDADSAPSSLQSIIEKVVAKHYLNDMLCSLLHQETN